MWEAIESNRRKSWILIVVMGVLLVGLGFGGGLFFHPEMGGAIGAVVALVLWFFLWMLAIFQGDNVMLAAAGAKKIEKQDAPQLWNVVEEMTIASGSSRMPDIYVIHDDRPNAFAIGRKPEKSAVAATSGLLRMLNRDELQGVMAHEIGHLRNRDTSFLILAGVMLGAIILMAEIVVRMVFFGSMGRSRSSRGGGGAQIIILIVAIALAILAPLLAQMLYFACSRRREYLADASAARFTRYPEGLASALEKISGSYKRTAQTRQAGGRKPSRVLAPMYIINPMQALAAVGLFSTHPPTGKRVQILRSMSGGASFGDYNEAYKRTMGGGGVLGNRTLAGDSAVARREASPGKDSKKDAAQRSHVVVPMFGRLDNLILMNCACGVGMKVPPQLNRPEIPCPRCGKMNVIPTAMLAGAGAGGSKSSEKVRYRRQGRGWESVKCPCGRAIQISPAFAASTISCGGCKQTIDIV